MRFLDAVNPAAARRLRISLAISTLRVVPPVQPNDIVR